jgi:hypothetical protein
LKIMGGYHIYSDWHAKEGEFPCFLPSNMVLVV